MTKLFRFLPKTKLSAGIYFLKKNSALLVCVIILLVISTILIAVNRMQSRNIENLDRQLNEAVTSYEKEIEKIKSEDQFARNDKLQKEIENIEKTYGSAVEQYEEILNTKQSSDDIEESEEIFAQILSYLSERNFASASAKIDELEAELAQTQQQLIQSFSIPENTTESNTPPSSGYSRQKVSSEIGDFLVDIVSADLNSTRVIVDTASDSDCSNDCPVLPLADYVSRNGGFAGVNGSYFCPASYPSCQGKTNTFDTLLMNKNKVYFNSENNVYSTVPVAIFGSGWARFMGRSLDWGRDTNVDGVIANQPLLLSGGNIAFGGDGDPKKGSKGTRSFVGVNGSTIYIGVVHNATVAEVAYALKSLGLTDALNLDSGGSTALWSGGYKIGPGRNIPNAVIFVRK